MGIDHLKKYGEPRPPPLLGECFESSETPVEYIEFRNRANNIATVQYSLLSVVTLNASVELILHFGDLAFVIKGRNLPPLVRLFSERRITHCKVGDNLADTHSENLPFVSDLTIPDSIDPDKKGNKKGKNKTRAGEARLFDEETQPPT